MSIRSLAHAFAVVLFLAARVWAQYPAAVPVAEELATGFDSITEAQSKEWLAVLTGADMNGRGTGQRGFNNAAKLSPQRVRAFMCNNFQTIAER
jgi:hypothetical protein